MARHTHWLRLTVAVALSFLTLLAILPSLAQAQTRRGIPVNIESVPPGATVYLDSEADNLGVAPLRSVRIGRGVHTLIFRMPNFEEARLEINVLRRRETFRAVMRALGTIEVSPGNDGARGAEVRIDGQPVGAGALLGAMPIRVENLTPGRHEVQVQRDGYTPFEQWVDVQGGQLVRITALLQQAAPDHGSILVSADASGAPVFLDGQQVGQTPMVIQDVTVGMHTVEIRPDVEGLTPFSQQVPVTVGAQVTINASLRPATANTGTIAVITQVAGARVRINAQELPSGAFSRDGLPPGNYVVQVLAEGYEAFSREVVVTAGQTTSVDATGMRREVGPPGEINIIVANAPGAMVTVDEDSRPAPYIESQPEPKNYSVVIRAEGFEDAAFSCSTVPGTAEAASCERTVTMEPVAIPIRVTLTNEILETPFLFVDDQRVGQVPYDGRLPAGGHTIEIRARGYQTYYQQVDVREGDQVIITTHLRDASEEAAAKGGSHGALPIPLNHPMIDLSVGWPYLGELRLGIGLHELVDAGFALRTFGRITEFEGRVRMGTRVLRQLALGGEVRFGGGVGPSLSLREPNYRGNDGNAERLQNIHVSTYAGDPVESPVNTAFFAAQGMLSLLLEPVATVTLWAGFEFASDQYNAHPRNSGAYLDYIPAEGMSGPCSRTAEGTLRCPGAGRQDLFRVHIGGAVDFAVSEHFNIWFSFDAAIDTDPYYRRLYSGFITDEVDFRVYPRLGVTFKF